MIPEEFCGGAAHREREEIREKWGKREGRWGSHQYGDMGLERDRSKCKTKSNV